MYSEIRSIENKSAEQYSHDALSKKYDFVLVKLFIFALHKDTEKNLHCHLTVGDMITEIDKQQQISINDNYDVNVFISYVGYVHSCYIEPLGYLFVSLSKTLVLNQDLKSSLNPLKIHQ